MAYVRWISTVPGVNMKRKLIVILSLVLCFMLSCNEETLDKVFIQGGMDAASPRVIVAVDPDSVHSFLEGEITTLDKEEIREEIALDEIRPGVLHQGKRFFGFDAFCAQTNFYVLAKVCDEF